MRTIEIPPPLGDRTVPKVAVPDTMSVDALVQLVRVAFSIPAAFLTSNRAVVSAAGLAFTTMSRHVAAYGTPAWREIVARNELTLAKLWTVRRSDEFRRVDDLFDPAADADPRVPRWARWIVGHHIGKHGAGCPVCDPARAGQWEQVCRQTNCPPALLADLVRSLETGGYLPAERLHGALAQYEAVDL